MHGERGSQVKKQVCLLGILWLIVVEGQLNASVFANEAEESQSPQIPIEEFVRSLHPHGVSMTSAIPYKSSSSSSSQDNVRTLLEMLNNKDERPFWPTILDALSTIGPPSVAPSIIAFIKKLEEKHDLVADEIRALDAAYWDLGKLIHINQRGDADEKANDELEEASNFLITKIRGREETPPNQQHGFPPSSQLPGNDSSNEGLIEAKILGVAFIATEEAKGEIAKIRAREKDPKFRSFLDQVLLAVHEIQEVGLLCYSEPESPGCQLQQIKQRNGKLLSKGR